MKDRTPTYPGRVLITPEGGGTPYYAVMTMADEPTEEGDAPTKANLFPDTVATALGLNPNDNPQVKDALLVGGNPKIGTIQTTARTDLGDKWMLCNGGPILSPNNYPDLSALLPVINAVSTLYDGTITATGFYKRDGKYIVVGYTSSYDVRLLYTTDLYGTWNEVTIPVSFTGTPAIISISLTYENDMWLLNCSYGVKIYVAYCETIDGTWTSTLAVSSSNNMNYVSPVHYANGYWYFTYSIYDSTWYTRVAYATSLSSFSSISILANQYLLTCFGVGYESGAWYALVSYHDDNGYTYLRKYTCTNAAPNSWVYNSELYSSYVGSGSTVPFYPTNYLVKAGGYWVCSSSASGLYEYGATLSSISHHAKSMYILQYDDDSGLWVASGYNSATVYAYSDVSLATSVKSMDTLLSSYPVFALLDDDENLIAAQGTQLSLPYPELPSISVDNAYAYIKALD